MFDPLIEAGAAKRVARGRPRLHPESVVADKSYSSDRIRNYLKSKPIKPVIPLRSDQTKVVC